MLSNSVIVARRFETEERESVIAERLSQAQAQWPTVAIGSYPQFDSRPWTVTVTMDSRDLEALDACEAALKGAIEVLDR